MNSSSPDQPVTDAAKPTGEPSAADLLEAFCAFAVAECAQKDTPTERFWFVKRQTSPRDAVTLARFDGNWVDGAVSITCEGWQPRPVEVQLRCYAQLPADRRAALVDLAGRFADQAGLGAIQGADFMRASLI